MYLKEISVLDAFLHRISKNNKFINDEAFMSLNLVESHSSFGLGGENVLPKNNIILHFLRNYKGNDELIMNSRTFLNQLPKVLQMKKIDIN